MLTWLDQRTGAVTAVKGFLTEDVPGGASYWYAFGSATVFAMMVQIATGIFLCFFYAPSTATAYESTKYLIEKVPAGHLVLSLHYWGASAMIAFMAMHLLQGLLWGAYKKPRELQWVVHADDPLQIARFLVGAPKQPLQQVHRHERDHRRGAPVVQREHEVPGGDFLDQVLGRLVRRRGRRRVEEAQKDPRRDLDHHREDGCAAERIPVRSAAGDVLGEETLHRGHRAGALVEPGQHGCLSDLLDDQVLVVVPVLDPRDLHFALVLAQRQRVEPAQRRTEFVLAQLRVRRAVARAEELVLLGAPAVFAAEVRTDRAEHDEAHVDDRIRKLVRTREQLGPRVLHLTFGGLDGPHALLGIGGAEVAVGLVNVERHFRRHLVGRFFERGGLFGGQPGPLIVRRVGGRDQRDDQRDGETDPDHAAQRDDGVRHERPPGLFVRRPRVFVGLCVSHVFSSELRRRAIPVWSLSHLSVGSGPPKLAYLRRNRGRSPAPLDGQRTHRNGACPAAGVRASNWEEFARERPAAPPADRRPRRRGAHALREGRDGDTRRAPPPGRHQRPAGPAVGPVAAAARARRVRPGPRRRARAQRRDGRKVPPVAASA